MRCPTKSGGFSVASTGKGTAALAGLLLTVRVRPLPGLADYRIVQRIKVPDGGFDYATFDAATGRVLMARTDFTTVIEAKTGKISQLNSAAPAIWRCPSPAPKSDRIAATSGNGSQLLSCDIFPVLASMTVREVGPRHQDPTGRGIERRVIEAAVRDLYALHDPVIGQTGSDETRRSAAIRRAPQCLFALKPPKTLRFLLGIASSSVPRIVGRNADSQRGLLASPIGR